MVEIRGVREGVVERFIEKGLDYVCWKIKTRVWHISGVYITHETIKKKLEGLTQ